MKTNVSHMRAHLQGFDINVKGLQCKHWHCAAHCAIGKT